MSEQFRKKCHFSALQLVEGAPKPRRGVRFGNIQESASHHFLMLNIAININRPVESVISLCKAEEISSRHALHLWIGSVLRSEYLSRSYSRMIFTYQQLLESPDSILDSCSLLWSKSFAESTSPRTSPSESNKRMVGYFEI